MTNTSAKISEQTAARAFSKQAPVFDHLYSADTIIQYKRKRVREHIEQWLAPQSQILELNAGTGEDTIYFAQKGYRIHATDISKGMQEMLVKKIEQNQLGKLITLEAQMHLMGGELQHTWLDSGREEIPFSHSFGPRDRLELPCVPPFRWSRIGSGRRVRHSHAPR